MHAHTHMHTLTHAHTHTHTHTQREYAERTEWCLQWLANKAGVTNSLRRVYEVEALLCELAAHMDGRGPTFFQAVDYLKTSSFDHTQATRCLWHEQRENKNCSLGCCKIYCFVISDAVCQKYGVSMTSQHLPRCSDVRPALFGPVASGRSTPSGRSTVMRRGIGLHSVISQVSKIEHIQSLCVMRALSRTGTSYMCTMFGR